uniref:Uncharacterized protein n=1 Tax=Glossina pallidipes TaxID=7398 RepID=A0A1B0A7H8_GLOPL
MIDTSTITIRKRNHYFIAFLSNTIKRSGSLKEPLTSAAYKGDILCYSPEPDIYDLQLLVCLCKPKRIYGIVDRFNMKSKPPKQCRKYFWLKHLECDRLDTYNRFCKFYKTYNIAGNAISLACKWLLLLPLLLFMYNVANQQQILNSIWRVLEEYINMTRWFD